MQVNPGQLDVITEEGDQLIKELYEFREEHEEYFRAH